MNDLPKPHRPNDPLPLVGVSACRKVLDNHFPGHWASERYLTAVTDGAGALPILIPALGGSGLADSQLHNILERLDGLVDALKARGPASPGE